MFNVTLEVNELQAFLKGFGRQVRYGTKNGLNEIALIFQRVQRAHQRRVFEYSGSSGERFWHQGVKIPKGAFATMQKMESSVWWVPKSRKGGELKEEIFLRQQYGGTRVPIEGRKRLTIPMDAVERTPSGQIVAREKPTALKRAFFVPTKSGGKLMFARTSPRQKKYVNAWSLRARGGGRRPSLKQDPNVEFLYYLPKKGQVKKVYDFYENAERVWKVHANRVLRDKLLDAFRTARP